MTTTKVQTESYTGPDRRAPRAPETLNEASIVATLALIGSMTAEELLAIKKAHQLAEAKSSREVLTAEERRQRKNEAQAKVRATPEGRAKANEASRKSIANRKRAEAIKALLKERIEQQQAAALNGVK